MSPDLDNSWVQGFIIEFVAALIIAVVSFIVGKMVGRYFERRKLVKQFYEGIMPVLKTISVVCDDGKEMHTKDIRAIVQSISKSFSDVYLKDDSWLILKSEVKRPVGTTMTCGVCDDKLEVSQDICPYCSLDCRSWDFTKIRTNEIASQRGTAPPA